MTSPKTNQEEKEEDQKTAAEVAAENKKEDKEEGELSDSSNEDSDGSESESEATNDFSTASQAGSEENPDLTSSVSEENSASPGKGDGDKDNKDKGDSKIGSEEEKKTPMEEKEEEEREKGKSKDDSEEDNKEKGASGSQPDPFVVPEDQVHQPEADPDDVLELDSEGFLDVTGSGRLRVKTLVKAEDGKSAGKPQQGQEVSCKMHVDFQGQTLLPSHDVDFFLGSSEVLPCLDLTAALMRKGEQVHIIADPEIAYGSHGLPSAGIPPSAAVDIFLTLVEVRDAPLVSELPLEEKFRYGRRKKERGTFWFQREKYTEAIQNYRKSAEFFDDERLDLEVPIDRYSLPADLQELLQERLKALNNLAMAQLKIEANQSALATLRAVLKIEPNNEKALYRKAKALIATSCLDEAMGVLKRVTRLYPENKQAKADLVNMQARNKKYKEAQERMSKRMLGLDKHEKEKKEASDSQLSSYVTWGLVIGGIGAAAGAVAAYLKVR